MRLDYVYMARLVRVKKTHTKKCTDYDEIGLCVQNRDTILGSIVNTMGEDLCSRLRTKRNLQFLNSYHNSDFDARNDNLYDS